MADLLHYYCSSRTFLSILQKRELWLTSLALSNDALEGEWALQQYLRLFKREDRSRRMGAKLDIGRTLQERVALGMCFSEKHDLLSQWRGYADNGRGVCLTFRAERINEAIRTIQTDTSGLKLTKISYDGIGSRSLPKTLYDAFWQGINNFSLDENGVGRLSRSHTLEQHEKETNAVTALFEHKNPAFSEEQEWRILIVQFPSRLTNLEYRESRGLLSPYIRMPIAISALHKVTLGPQHPTPKSIIEGLVKSFKCKAEVQISGASYVSR